MDGKQRLTAILRFMGCHPDGVAFARSISNDDAPMELYESNYKKWRRKLGLKAAIGIAENLEEYYEKFDGDGDLMRQAIKKETDHDN